MDYENRINKTKLFFEQIKADKPSARPRKRLKI